MYLIKKMRGFQKMETPRKAGDYRQTTQRHTTLSDVAFHIALFVQQSPTSNSGRLLIKSQGLIFYKIKANVSEPKARIELGTPALRKLCSTN